MVYDITFIEAEYIYKSSKCVKNFNSHIFRNEAFLDSNSEKFKSLQKVHHIYSCLEIYILLLYQICIVC